MSTNGTVLDVQNLTCIPNRSGLRVVDDVSFSIQRGESVGLLGESGVGKTTLFRAILGLLPPDEWNINGEIAIDGIQVVGLPPKSLEKTRGRKVRSIFQEPAQSLNPSLKLDRQLIEAIQTISPELNEKECWEKASQALLNAGLPDPNIALNRYPADLSGGQRQRVGIAMSLCRQCSILLADEPSNSLDSLTVTELIETLKKLKADSYLGSVFCVTHDLSVLKALETDRVLFMHAGKLYESGDINQTLEDPGHEKLKELVDLAKKVNRHLAEGTEEEASKASEALIDVEKVDFGFRKKSLFQKKHSLVLHDINLTIYKGEFLALVGSSGSGKSTIGGLLSRIFSGFEGEISFDGIDLKRFKNRKEKARFYRSLQVVFQDPADTFDPSLTMRQNLMECFTAMGLDQQQIAQSLAELLELMRLEERTLDELPRNLSGGQKQRFALVRAFGAKPAAIIADEPFTHLDLIAQNRLIEYLKSRKQDSTNPLSCILISHEIGIVSKLCDRIVVIDDGRIVEQNTVDKIVNDPQHDVTNRLIDAAKTLGTFDSF